jgi:hemolysin activation/secretion protein
MLSVALLALLTLTLAPDHASAQIAPDAGQSERELERRPLEIPAEKPVDIQLPAELSANGAADGRAFTVNGFTISGNRVFPAATLLARLSDLTGKTMTLAELQAAASRITQYYRENGYLLTQAFVPAQTVEDGRVAITVMEGYYGKIEVDNRSSLRPFALAPLSALKEGTVARAADIERALLLMNERDGVSVSASLRPGSEVGTTALRVAVEPTRRFTGRVEYDNAGNRYTGEHRFAGRAAWNNPLGLGDRLDAQLLGTIEEQIYYRFSYQVPFGSMGTSAGVGYSHMEYELGEEFEALDAYGTARTTTVFLTQPIVASRRFELTARAQYENRHLRDVIGLFDATAKKRSDVGAVSLGGIVRDEVFGGGVNSFDLTWRYGSLDIRDAMSYADDRLTSRRDGAFNVLAPSIARLQRLDDRFSLLLNVRGQWANKNLDGSEKFGLGGAYGVRAYPQGEAQADAGVLGTAELRYSVIRPLQVSGFIDSSWAKLNSNPWDGGKNERSLSGAGIGATWTDPHFRLGINAAWRVGGEEPLSDTTDRTPRIWGNVAFIF